MFHPAFVCLCGRLCGQGVWLDNFAVGDDINAALKLAEDTWRPKFVAHEAVVAAEKKKKKEKEDKLAEKKKKKNKCDHVLVVA